MLTERHNPIWPIAADWQWETISNDRWTKLRWIMNRSMIGPNELEAFSDAQIAAAASILDEYEAGGPVVTPPPPVDPPPPPFDPNVARQITITISVRPNGSLHVKAADAVAFAHAVLLNEGA